MADDQRITRFVLRDAHRDHFYTAAAEGDRLLELIPVEDERRLALYAANHRIPLPEPIPDWTVRFEPDSDYSVDWANRRLNTFQPAPLLRNALASRATDTIPPLTARLLHCLTGGDAQVQAHLLNWLAALVQRRTRLGTAWLFHGLPGTGKRLLVDSLLRPLLGAEHVVRCTVADLAATTLPVQAFEQALLVVVDPFDPHKTTRTDRLMLHLHQLIDDPVLPQHRTTPALGAQSPNHINILLCADYPEPLTLSADDRRFNIAPASGEQLVLTSAELETLIDPAHGELADFAAHLAHRSFDARAVSEVLDHPARSRAIEASGAVDACFAALRAGNLDYFHALLEREEQYLEPRDRDRLRRFCRQWARDLEAGRPSRIFLEGLQRLAAIAAGHVVANATFRASAKRYGLKPKPLWNKHERKTGRGIVVRFQSNDTLGGAPSGDLSI
ncbi:MAG: hypothetical protein ACLFSI_08155 [Halorhodospira sp.]